MFWFYYRSLCLSSLLYFLLVNSFSIFNKLFFHPFFNQYLCLLCTAFDVKFITNVIITHGFPAMPQALLFFSASMPMTSNLPTRRTSGVLLRLLSSSTRYKERDPGIARPVNIISDMFFYLYPAHFFLPIVCSTVPFLFPFPSYSIPHPAKAGSGTLLISVRPITRRLLLNLSPQLQLGNYHFPSSYYFL